MKDDMEHIEIGEVPINSDNIVSDCENPLVSPNLKEKTLRKIPLYIWLPSLLLSFAALVVSVIK